jgi:hypothetical protein
VLFGASLIRLQPVTTGHLPSQKKQASLVAQVHTRPDEMIAQMCDSFRGAIRVSPRNRSRKMSGFAPKADS